MSVEASSRVSASGFRLNTRRLMCSTAPGSSPFARPTFQIASSWRVVMPPRECLLLGCPLPGGPLGLGRVPFVGVRTGGCGAVAGRDGAPPRPPNLQALKQARGLRISDVQFLPLSIRRFVERYARMVEDERKRDPDKFSR